MNAKTIVVKKVNEPPYIAQVEDALVSMQSIVEGHLDPLTVAADGAFQVMMMRNEDGALTYNSHPKFDRDEPMSINFVFPNGPPIYGPCFVTKRDGNGNTVSLSEQEADAWVEFLSKIGTRLPTDDVETPSVDKPEPYLTDSHQVLLLPPGLADEETGNVLSPEDLVGRIAKQVGVEYNLIPVDNDQIYGVAIACLEAQGVDFDIDDEATMLLDISGKDDDDKPGRVKKFLRVIEITGFNAG